ncbi:Exosome complex exonuclease RRP44-like protein A [Picochlorum sp. SENEW3]|nr:Exosome complex exonuclease RRP44-like protein A [Picochlorum sp. SENEW3]
MLKSKSFVKKTKRGKILKVVREHYLRDDIYSGSELDPECPEVSRVLSGSASCYIILDTNVVLHQIDLVEHPDVQDVIVPSVVLNEVKARNSSVYQRLRKVIASKDKRFYVFANEHHRETYITAQPHESPNDRNDRSIRVTAEWYAKRIPAMRIVLVSDDRDNREKLSHTYENLLAKSSMEYAKMRENDVPGLLDLIAHFSNADNQGIAGDGAPRKSDSNKKKIRIYREHESTSKIMAAIKAGTLHQGSLRVSRYNPFEGWVGSQSIGQDILIRNKLDMNRAMDGDIVAVELLPEDKWKAPCSKLPEKERDTDDLLDAEDTGVETPHVAMIDPEDDPSLSGEKIKPTGVVVGIIKRNWRSRGYCGSLLPPKEGAPPYKDSHTTSVLFCPIEKKYPMVRIQTRQLQTLQDKRLVVAIDGWSADSAHPDGHYVRTLGTIGDKEVETEVLIIENDINTAPFTPAVHACVPPLPWKVVEGDLADPNRKDFRHLPICSVDPPGCKDIDDALHVRELPGGNIELGVHIADVTHFLHPDSPMDIEASARATTTYLVQRRIDMLPKPLTEDICSLRANVERLAFSVIWEMTENAEILSTSFTKSVIKSRAALTYAEAQARIDDDRMQDEITKNLRIMNKIAKILRKKRMDRGALELASPEVKFEIDTETQDPLDVGMYQLRETNQMVEEMMLLANCSVAEKCLTSFPSNSLLRRHPVPPPRQFEPLLKAASAVGISIDTDTSKALAESLDKAVRKDDPYFNKLIRIMATRCMTQAIYFSSAEVSKQEYYHYGLAAPIYTHFTSPIRRYADVIVHRVLMAALGLNTLPDSLRDGMFMHQVVDNLNIRHRNAQHAGRASVDLHTLIFFKDKEVIADARVTRVKSNAIIVFIPKFGLEGSIMLEEDEAFILDEESQSLKKKSDATIAYKIFDPCAVKIQIQEGFGKRQSLVLRLVSRDEISPEDKMTQ